MGTTPTFGSAVPAPTVGTTPTFGSAVPAPTVGTTPTFGSAVPVPTVGTSAAPVAALAPFAPFAPITTPPGVEFTLPPIIASTYPKPAEGFPVCLACGPDFFVKEKNKFVAFYGLKFLCGDVEAGGLQGSIPAELCNKALVEAVAVTCGCDRILYSEAPSSGPVGEPTNAPSAGITLSGLVGSVLSSFLLFSFL